MNAEKQISEEELIPLLLKKSSNGLEVLYDNYSSSLYGVIHRIVQNEEVSELLLKITFIKIWNNFSQYNPSKDRLAAWMITIARNTAMDKRYSSEQQNKGQYKSIEKILAEATPLQAGGNTTEISGLKKLILEMDSEYSQILYLLFYAGFSQSEVALKLNIPLGTVKSRARTAILKLRTYLGQIPD